MKEILIIVLSAVLVENFVLTKFLGICPFIGVSKRLNTAIGMGGAVIFVLTLSSAITKLVYDLLLEPYGLEYLNTIAFILIIASLVQFVEAVLKKVFPPLYKALGIYLPLITTNCAVLGAALMGIERGYNLGVTVLFGFGAGLGFTLALVLFAGIREKLEENDIPESLKGFSISLIAAALVSLAFFGFQGLF
ncbi:MAG TPA: electron transport complex subunit RsxA [Ruminiclostridium sp.]|jgi:electron transport complex protein RnfA|uniref:Ion-translocating oxidoreductase complex subunit A n=1 Tax=Acetivibrio saccincola TaxID=1677857 RepID=A0A2K9EIF9_9FIRM|nr:electron transport complex subunit RsxA [Acetivibrio saccincola]HAA43468.1 electron transport complex subunit RsxA [Ruminiclostridium sp.]AUG56301.1 Electron transport complex protein RnfA [Acetivibrio saccincola]NLW25845.1 electron transport complex subunit RsxA [Acetivibrio saccincola]PQQ65498.1 electron transport complex subunit RsxA [Acetivibrio saccincola]HQD29570.1 electron transport complex subunit RsxA [Acetivibrio saccincola]